MKTNFLNRYHQVRGVGSVALLLCSAIGIATAGNIDVGTFSVDAKSTYLLTSGNDTAVNPIFINLAALSTPVAAGDILILSTVGDYCNLGGIWGCSPETSQPLGGVFSSLGPASLLPTNVLHRLPGAITTPGVGDSTDPSTWYGGLSTSISQDFYISTGAGLTVTVPTNAQWLVVGVLDSFYGDNSDPNHNLGVHILVDPIEHITTTTPEPASYALFLTGLGGLWAVRRLRSRRS